MLFRVLAAVALSVGVFVSAPAAAADKPAFKPPAAWVEAAALPAAPTLADPPAVQVVFDDNQSHLGGPDGDAYYNRRAWKILKPEGLGRFRTLGQTWDPAKETMTFHHIRIVRDGKTIDLLGRGEKMLVLRRERNLERAMLDGRLTANQQIDGLQVGDIVDYAYTQTRRDPIVAGRSYDQEGLGFAGPAARYRAVVSWPEAAGVKWRATPGYPEPAVAARDGRIWLRVDETNILAPDAPVGAPARFRRVGVLESSGFASWREVSTLMAPHYAKAAALSAGSAVKAEAAAIAARHADPKARAFAALQLVEEKTRYFFVGLNDGGYVPAAADLTWERKFGDCKGKTALLLALLRELGVEAEPALVSLGGGDGMDERPPSLAAFNHVIVRATIGGRVYWLDGTRTGDVAGLDRLRPPAVYWALPVRAAGADLEKVPQTPLDEPVMEAVLRIDASQGLDKPAPTTFTMVLRGDAARTTRQRIASIPRADIERSFRQLASASQEFQAETLDWTDRPDEDAFEVRLTGKAELSWIHNADVGRREYRFAAGGPVRVTFQKREPGPNRDAPYTVPFPAFSRGVTEIVLPDNGRGFIVRGPNLDRVLAGQQHRRVSDLQGGVARFVVEARALQPEVTLPEAEAAAEAGRKLLLEDSIVRAPA